MDAKKQSFINALHDAFGNVSKACKTIGINRTTYYNWKEADEDFKNAVDSIDEYIIDTVENSLFEQIKSKNTAATIFYLKTKAKQRGYIERTEIEQNTTIQVPTINIQAPE